jgi:hypothetical protein
MSDASDAVDDLNKSLQTTDALVTSIAAKTKSIGGNIRGGGAGGAGGGQVANYSSSTTGNASSTGSGGGSGGILDVGGIPDFKDPNARSTRQKLFGSAMQGVGAISAMLPSTQEAMNLDALANRLRFYGQSGSMRNIGGAFAVQSGAAVLGTPTSAIDAAAAANQGAGQGLLPGLSNYGATGTFGGVLGGAALASNLTPGLGLQGGMSAMAGLNTARNVNMLRMIGVNVRNSQGQMNDLPDVIGQVFKMLEQSAGTGNVTAQSIAVSAMSGNALDSILSQYFGNDAALRQTVLAGLIQMANSGGTSLRTAGTREGMLRTGGLSAPVVSLATRNVSEQNMLQQWSRATNEGFIGANDMISGMYGGLSKLAGGGTSGNSTLDRILGAGSGLLKSAQAAMVGIDTFGGARGGAGALLTDSLVGAGSAFFPRGSGMAAPLGLAAAGLGIVGAGAGTNFDPNRSPGTSGDYGPLPVSTAPVYTGAITINVTAPTGSDPWAFANQVTTSMINAARS